MSSYLYKRICEILIASATLVESLSAHELLVELPRTPLYCQIRSWLNIKKALWPNGKALDYESRDCRLLVTPLKASRQL
jgi:hypothetical protein